VTAAGPRVLVVGAGSIGARHARNLVAEGAEVVVTDPDEARASSVAEACGATSVALDLDRLGGHGTFDGAVVASPTSLHATQAQALLATVPKLLVEKPLGLDGAEAEALADAADRVAVAYNLRFHAPMQRVVELIAEGRAGAVSAIDVWFGSWLPDWRPQVDYRTTYSARAELGGGVLLDVIHELDLLVWLGGEGAYEVLGAAVRRSGHLDLDVEDTVRAIVALPSGAIGTVALDYLARRYRRGVEVTGDEATVRLDWARAVIEVETAAEVRREQVSIPVDVSYERQAAAFVAWLAGGPPLPVDAACGLASLRLADAIRARGR
jgi:predicted dehydrogenase